MMMTHFFKLTITVYSVIFSGVLIILCSQYCVSKLQPSQKKKKQTTKAVNRFIPPSLKHLINMVVNNAL